MISPEAARQFAESNFPEAPERLAQHLAIDVRYSTMSGCDGYCLVLRDKAIVRINSQLSPYRKRFTLAHELGHIILGIPGVVGESFEQMIGSKETEERRVNAIVPFCGISFWVLLYYRGIDRSQFGAGLINRRTGSETAKELRHAMDASRDHGGREMVRTGHHVGYDGPRFVVG